MIAWRDRAACIGTNPALWDDEPTHRDQDAIRAAKQICASCPVLEECRAHALLTAEPAGIWGGFTEQERNLILKRNPRPSTRERKLLPCGTEGAFHRHTRRGEPIDKPCREAALAAQRKRHARRQRSFV